MCRKNRVKDPDSVNHIINNSVSDIPLFRNSDDKNKFLEILNKYKHKFGFIIYAYCLMDTHYHLAIYCNGADISAFMKVINQSYAQYYNVKYGRRGPVFRDRFKNFIIKTNNYLLAVSAYIHNNAKDIIKYANNVAAYKYSSLGIYIDKFKDIWELIDTSFILQQFSNDVKHAKKLYLEFVYKTPYSDVCIDEP